tara:strand:- start:27 stop:542 length:516 start_codon:yes stop_codon:yes gene_type:complete
MKAVFLDRDGVINIDKKFVYKICDFQFIDGVFDALKYLINKKFNLFIVTNQSGIGRKLYTIKDFEKVNNWMINKFLDEKIIINEVQFCYHHPDDNCDCRKPKTGMIDEILKNNNIDLNQSWLIGDKNIDMELAINSKIKNKIQVKSGKYFDERESKADFIIDSIKDIKKII